jgi:FOG: CheY-like receiver
MDWRRLLFFKEKHPALVLMDIKMPEMDGIEALKGIRDLSPDFPVIAVTAYAFEENIREIMNSGFNDYLIKPIRCSIEGKIGCDIAQLKTIYNRSI